MYSPNHRANETGNGVFHMAGIMMTAITARIPRT
jgi:hypothetical protein